MTVDERMITFINSFDKANSIFLEELEQEAKNDFVPIIRKDMQNLLRFLLRLKQPENILEVGTAIGFSAILMAENTKETCQITTIEKFEKRIPLARENFKKAGMQERITLLEGDAKDILEALEPAYDFIFMDAAKAQYLSYLPDLVRLLAPGGMLVSDNVLQDGDVCESRFAVTRRNRTIHNRMRQYLYEIKNHPQLDSVILTVGDGVTISVKKVEEEANEQHKEA